MVRRVGWLGLVALLVTVASILACRQTIGIDQYFNAPADAGSDASAVTSACGLPYGTTACASCAATSCCTESSACGVDPTCAAYEGCLGTCGGDPKCRSQCTIDHPVGLASDVLALDACLAGKCGTACGLECGGVANLISPPDAAVACQQCLSSQACSQAQACASSQLCLAYTRTLLAFSTVDAVETSALLQCSSSTAAGFDFNIGGLSWACGRNPPTIDADAAVSSTVGAFGFTGGSPCTTPCAFGNYWACVGHVTWPGPKAPTSAIGATVKDYVTGAPVTGALVQVCAPHDPNCSQGLAQGTTDATGRISLQFPNVRDPAGTLGLNGFLRITSPTIVPYNFYWGSPLSEADLPNVSLLVATPAEFQAVWNTVNVTLDPTRGTVAVYVVDCRSQVAPGVQVTLSTADALTQGYTPGGMVTTTTDQSGLIVFSNVPAGALQITATPLALGKASSQLSVNVQPGTTTHVLVSSTPNP